LAQAALETGWGQAQPSLANGLPANNLFGVKAGASWQGQRVSRWTLEHVDGIAERRREQFRAYASPAESFADYVDLLKGSSRYAEALAVAGSPAAFARALSGAGYATDPAYADKWLAIYRGEPMRAAERSAFESANAAKPYRAVKQARTAEPTRTVGQAFAAEPIRAAEQAFAAEPMRAADLKK
jgi:hypothetical protein